MVELSSKPGRELRTFTLAGTTLVMYRFLGLMDGMQLRPSCRDETLGKILRKDNEEDGSD